MQFSRIIYILQQLYWWIRMVESLTAYQGLIKDQVKYPGISHLMVHKAALCALSLV